MSYLPSLWSGGTGLAGLTDEQLQQLSQQSGIAFPMLKQQQMAEMASSAGQLPGDDENTQMVPTVEIKLHSNPKNPAKARRKNIKMLRKVLRPPRYWFGLFSIYRYNGSTECACCGVDCNRFMEGGDSAYAHIIDEDTRKSLADIYWFDDETGKYKKPHARTHGDIGDELNSTLCPAHLHIYHTLRKLVQEDELAGEGLSRPVSQGTKFMRVPGLSMHKNRNRATSDSLIKYEPFFKMIQQDVQYQKGITLTQHPNPLSGVADLVTVTFDLRALQLQDLQRQNSTIGVPAVNNAINASPQQQQANVPSPNPQPEAGTQ